MTNPESPRIPEESYVVPPANAPAQPHEDINPEQAQLTIDTLNVLRHPAVSSLTEMGQDKDTRTQAVQYMQQLVLANLFSDGVRGGNHNLRTRKLMDQFAEQPTHQVTLPLRSANKFHNCFYAYAKVQDKTGPEQTSDIVSGRAGPNITLAAQDMMALYDRGLVDKEGDTGNLQILGDILRFLNVNLLFTADMTKPGFVDTYFDTVLEKMTGEAPLSSPLDRQANQYAALYSRPTIVAKQVKALRRLAGPNVDALTNRAALHVALSGAKAELIEMLRSPKARSQYASALRVMGDTDLAALADKIVPVVDQFERPQTTPILEKPVNEEDEERAESIVQATELNWEVLPPGELEQKAREIVEGHAGGSGKEVTIDLERLQILENVRQAWGADRCFYVRGQLGKRRLIKKDGKEEPDQYLLLILQEHDDEGNVVQEHAVAESPIAGPNALYVFRQDVSEGFPWRDVMALPKDFARALNARALKHVVPRNAPEGYLVPSMTQKVVALLSCQKPEFLAIKFEGDRGIRIPKGVVPEPES